jgi:predicted LPLAT superfamily acyltransferase
MWAEQWWPRWVFRPLLMAGTWIAVMCLPSQRAHSQAYLAVVLGRAARPVEVWRHFYAFTDVLVLKLRAARGSPVRCVLVDDNAAGFDQLLAAGRAALFGSFHFGGSDLLGYLLSDRGRHVTLIRLKMGNSPDTEWLGARFAQQVSFLWVNDPASLMFALKAAIESGESLALKCDRLEYSARSEPFEFLGARRLFPFTIYHLALMFDRPVVFCTAVPDTLNSELQVHASPVFTPNPAWDRATNTQAARQHFQSVLSQLETLVRRHPSLWFNFLPLNPAVPAGPA